MSGPQAPEVLGVPPAPQRGILRDLALRLDKSSRTFADECLRFRFEESADLLALMASHGALGYDELLGLVRDVLAGHRPVEDAATALDPYALSSLMRLIAGLHMGERLMTGDFEQAADISQVARMIRGDMTFGDLSARVEGQVNLAVGRFEHVEEMLAEDELSDDTAWTLSTELAHPAHGRPGATSESWLPLFNRRFEEFGALPITITDGPGAAFDRVHVDVPDSLGIDDGPLVTVVMSAYRPGHSLRTAMGSVIAQTWRNLEILLVDDCSPPEFDPLLTEVAGLDPRIELIRMPTNGGTYRIRNEAIRRSRGEFIAFQDSDDWAHPERIARQIRPLLEPQGLVATHCRCVRTFPNLSTLNVGLNSFRRCEASTVFRKDVVIPALGGFDETRKSADNEFYERIGVVFGEDAYVNLPDVLVMTQLTEDSLSRDELRFAWQHGARSAYVQARGYWHRQIEAGRESARLEPGSQRSIVAPHRILTGEDTPPAECDILWISDWREGLSRYVGQSRLVEATADAGLATLVAQATAIRHANRDRVNLGDDILTLQAAGKTRIAIVSDDTHARLAVIVDPEILNLTRSPESVGIRADRLIVAAPHPPEAPEGQWLTYRPDVVEQNALRMFGRPIEWLPATEPIAEALRRQGARSVLAPSPLVVAPRVDARPYSGARGAESLIVGTAGLERTRRDRPSFATLRDRIPSGDDFDVRLLFDAATTRRIGKRRTLPTSWLVMLDSMPVDRFLRQLDAFVAIPTRSWGPSLHWTVVSALAEGAIVLADPDLRPFLGDAAVYIHSGDPAAALKGFVADSSLVDQQRALGYAFCRDRASADALVALVGRLFSGGGIAQ